MIVRALAVLALLVAAPDSAVSDDESELQRVAKLAIDDPKRAALVVRLVGKARKSMALDRQQRLARHVFELVPMKDGRLRPARVLPRIGRLNDPRSFACVSAHHLAYPALFGATASGDYSELEPALSLAIKRGTVRYGAYARAMADYARGIRSRADVAKAIPSFQKALATCAKHGWSELALHVGVELTIACLSSEDKEAVTQVMQDTFAAVREDTGAPVLYGARTAIRNRLSTGHPDLFEAWDGVLAKRLKGYRRGGGAGAGGDGRRRQATPLSKALRKWRKSKPLLRVTRNGDEFRIKYEFGDLPEKVHKRAAGITHVDHGGLTIAFHAGAVRLQQVSLNNEAVAGANAAPGTWQKFDPLADGESWSLYATGEVRFKGRTATGASGARR